MKDNDEFPALPWRRRLLLLVLGVATALTVMTTLLTGPGGARNRQAPDAARCTGAQSTGCVGGTASVIVAPPARPASAP